MNASQKIRIAIDGWEGNVLTCYLDPVGIPTIGKGFTNASKVLTKRLGKLKPGKTKITAAQSDAIFAEMLAKEYEPMVNMPGAKQHEFDVGVSTVWNLGPRSQNWQWAKLWRAGKKKSAADYLATHYNTAGGKVLPGLRRRRREEAEILLHAVYPGETAFSEAVQPEGAPRSEQDKPGALPDRVTKEAQDMLRRVGIDPGMSDGWYGPKTRAAVLTYQRMHPHLANDGILGPATLAQLRRDVAAVKESINSGGGAALLSGVTAAFAGLPWGWIVAGVAIAAVVYFAWKYRDVWERRFNKSIGRTVEV